MSGCLWSFLPLPILMALYYIIRRPMLYMMCLTEKQITAAIDAVKALGTYTLSGNAAYQEMQISGLMYGHSDVLAAVQNAVAPPRTSWRSSTSTGWAWTCPRFPS